MLTSKVWKEKITNVHRCTQGRKLILDIQDGDDTITLAVVYAPNEDNPAFFQELANNLRARQEKKIIVGDFNLTLDVEKDRKNTFCNNNKARDEVENIMEEFKLKETWRERNEESREYSWFKRSSGQQERKASRIDFALISGGLDQNVKEITYISSIKTDHRAIYIVLDLTENSRGRGYWKLNTLLLNNKEFVKSMNIELDRVLNSTEEKNPSERWECIKTRIKKAASEFSRKNISMEKEVIANLSEKVNDYESRLPLIEEEDSLYENTKADLEEKVMERIAGVMFRSKAKWHELGERGSKYFYSLEKARYNAKTCFKILDETKGEITNPQEIIETQRKFYAELYAKDEEVDFNMKNIFKVEVPDEIKNQQEQDISDIDIQKAIKGMSNNKTPGNDGIPIDFYKVFWTKLKEPFLNMVHEAYQVKTLHSTARQGILNLIPKANKDTRLIKNLRPITLLNTDYKIIEKAIANKMLPALEHIIHQDQRGFMKDRRISVNIRKMLDIIHQAAKEDLEAVVLSLDFVKCFDKCSFSILHGSLEFFGFGNIVKEWTRILYNNFTVQIQNNGNFSEAIPINKGVHQGGCCSSVYFLVIAEILALSLRSNTEIEGVNIHTIRNLLNQFADDMDIFSMA